MSTKKTGKTDYQIYFSTVTRAGGWPFFYSVNYEMPGGPEAAALTKVGSDVDCTGSRYGGCTYHEHVLITPTREVLDRVATTYVPNKVVAWKMRLKGQSGQTMDMFLTPAEVKGMLVAVDAYKAQHNLTQ